MSFFGAMQYMIWAVEGCGSVNFRCLYGRFTALVRSCSESAEPVLEGSRLPILNGYDMPTLTFGPSKYCSSKWWMGFDFLYFGELSLRWGLLHFFEHWIIKQGLPTTRVSKFYLSCLRLTRCTYVTWQYVISDILWCSYFAGDTQTAWRYGTDLAE